MTIAKKLANLNKKDTRKRTMEETECTSADDEHYDIRSPKDGHQMYTPWNRFDLEGAVCHARVDTAATIGLFGEDIVEKWQQACGMYGNEDDIMLENRRRS